MNENEQLVKDLRKLMKMAKRKQHRMKRQLDKHKALAPYENANRNDVITWSTKLSRLQVKLRRWTNVILWLSQEIDSMAKEDEPEYFQHFEND